jgi:hypothetical protein
MNHDKFKIICLIFGAPMWVACGNLPKSEGFISEANICRPLALPPYDPTDISTGQVAIPAPQTGVVKTAQLTAAETTKKNLWGVEFFLSSLTGANAQLDVTTLVKRVTPQLGDVLTVGPDNATAYQSAYGSTKSLTATTTPAWVRTQFPGVITLEKGDAVWLVTLPEFDPGQQLLWWYTTGDGIYVTAPSAPIYGKIEGIKTLYRLIYCE